MTEDRKLQYFGELAPNYALITGNVTQEIFARFLETSSIELSNDSIVHDNAAGPGTATQILVHFASGKGVSPKFIVTDYSKGMIDAFQAYKAEAYRHEKLWNSVDSQVCDSANLDAFDDGHFTHSFNNFSLFTFTHSVKSLRETLRTLRPGGFAFVSVWKRFAVQAVLAVAQDLVKGSGYAAAKAVPVNGPQYFEEGFAATEMIEAGFHSDKVHTSSLTYVLEEGKYWDGLYEFMTTSSIAGASTRGWTTEETAKWPQAVRQAMLEEKTNYGGIKFEAWIVQATK